MKNSYEVRGDVTVIRLNRKGKPYVTTEIDTADLPKLLALSVTWWAQWDPKTQSFYVRTKVQSGSKRVLVQLHRFLTDAPDGPEVDHFNHDTLDNRRSNLRVATLSENRLNCSGPRKTSKSGELGVCRSSDGRRWRAYIHRDKRQVFLGSFSDRAEAVAAARTAREGLTDMTRRLEAAGIPHEVTHAAPEAAAPEPQVTGGTER
jgi:hypothetical protein